MEGDKGAGISSHQGKPDQLPKRKGLKQDKMQPPKLEKTKKWGAVSLPNLAGNE
jgi:hypothetical protein